jgi:molybdenum cofactor guanylyltransferase
MSSGLNPSSLLAVILAGGAARRMGGGDKGMAEIDGAPMLAHVIRRLKPQVGSLLLNANGDAARFAVFGLRVIPDLDSRLRGPMSGILAAMTWAERAAPEVRALITVSTDVPFLPSDLASRLIVEGRGGPAIATSGGRRHPTIGLWPMTMKDAFAAALDSDELSVNSFANRHGAIEVSFAFSESGGALIDPFFNANTPGDLELARQLVKTSSNSRT